MKRDVFENQRIGLKETRIKDADKFLTLLTAEQGVMTVKARGVMRKSSRLSSGCQLFCYSDFTLFEGKSVTSVNAAEPINMFLGLRADAEKLALAAYFAELLDALGKTDGDTGELLRLGLNAFTRCLSWTNRLSLCVRRLRCGL